MPQINMEEIRVFVEEYFRALDLPLRWSDDILEVQIPPEVAAEIDGPRSRLKELRLAFAEEAAKQNPDAELLVPGSFRLDKIIQSCTARGKTTRQFLVWEGATHTLPPKAQRLLPPGTREFALLGGDIKYAPLILYRFRVSYLGVEKHEELAEYGVSLTDGIVAGSLHRRLSNWKTSYDAPNGYPLLKRKISFRRSYELAAAKLLDSIKAKNRSWAESSQAELKAEKEQLEKHFTDYERENPGADVEKEKKVRLKELEQRFFPRVIARPYAAALLYVPCIVYRVRLLTEGKGLSITYNPLLDEAVCAGNSSPASFPTCVGES